MGEGGPAELQVKDLTKDESSNSAKLETRISGNNVGFSGQCYNLIVTFS